MKKTVAVFLLGFLVGALATWSASGLWGDARRRAADGSGVTPSSDICYSCIFEGYDEKVRRDLVAFYRQFTSADPMVAADARYVLWRATSTPNCDARLGYRAVAGDDPDPYRRFLAGAILGFSAPECRQSPQSALRAAAKGAEAAGLANEARLLREFAGGSLRPAFADVEIRTSLTVPASATAMVLGESRIEVTADDVVGVQVERVARDWISAQMKWAPSGRPLSVTSIRYHEGALVASLQETASPRVCVLAGSLVARRGKKWFAPDETGVFRFQVLEDKLQYPTTHVIGDLGFVEDTHGISLLVSQALERHVSMVIGCGDSEGKIKAAYYLAQHGVHAVFPGDRYQDLLIGYTGSGVLLGGAPVRGENGRAVLGGQPVRISLTEPIVVEDTKGPFPMQYYDAGARYFRRLSQFARLNLRYVEVDAPDQLDRVLRVARSARASAVAVRVVTPKEDEVLRAWLKESPHNRAILFHSGLYPYAQPLFRDFRTQVSFGDLRPRFE